MSDEIVFSDFAEKIDAFTESLVGNLKKEDLEVEKERENDERHVNIKKSFFFQGKLTSRKKEGDLCISFERQGSKSTWGLLLGPTIFLLILGFLLRMNYLIMFGAIIVLCAGQMLIQRKMKGVGQSIRNAIERSVESFPQLKKQLEERRQEQRQRLEKAEHTYFCPKCQKEFMVPELVSLHLKRKHDTKRELTEEDFEEGKVKEEIRAELEATKKEEAPTS